MEWAYKTIILNGYKNTSNTTQMYTKCKMVFEGYQHAYCLIIIYDNPANLSQNAVLHANKNIVKMRVHIRGTAKQTLHIKTVPKQKRIQFINTCILVKISKLPLDFVNRKCYNGQLYRIRTYLT